MDTKRFERLSDYAWKIPMRGAMRVPAIIFASETLVRDMDQKVFDQTTNVATLPAS